MARVESGQQGRRARHQRGRDVPARLLLRRAPHEPVELPHRHHHRVLRRLRASRAVAPPRTPNLPGRRRLWYSSRMKSALRLLGSAAGLACAARGLHQRLRRVLVLDRRRRRERHGCQRDRRREVGRNTERRCLTAARCDRWYVGRRLRRRTTGLAATTADRRNHRVQRRLPEGGRHVGPAAPRAAPVRTSSAAASAFRRPIPSMAAVRLACTACELADATAGCANGQCAMVELQRRLRQLRHHDANGCEDAAEHHSDCGACGRACSTLTRRARLARNPRATTAATAAGATARNRRLAPTMVARATSTPPTTAVAAATIADTRARRAASSASAAAAAQRCQCSGPSAPSELRPGLRTLRLRRRDLCGRRDLRQDERQHPLPVQRPGGLQQRRYLLPGRWMP